ncbi:MAG TPA: hypothetical protein PKA55_11845 [Rhodoblastus sp.]|nr:hypothetical protein [Rhodoblastus sp.]
MSALPWLNAAALSVRDAGDLGVADLVAILAAVVAVALISALCERPAPQADALSRLGGRS